MSDSILYEKTATDQVKNEPEDLRGQGAEFKRLKKELQKAQGELRANAEKYLALVEHAYDLILETSIDGRIIFANSKHKYFLGYEPGYLLGKYIFEFIHPEDLPSVIQEFRRAVQSESTGVVTYRCRHENGKWLWFESAGKAYRNNEDEVRTVIASHDVSDLRQAEDRAQRAKNELERRLLAGTDELSKSNEALQKEVKLRLMAETLLKDSLDQLAKKIRNEKIISAVAKTVHKSIELDEVLENAVQAMSDYIEGVQNVGIYLVEGKGAVLKAYRGYPDWFIKKVARIPYPKGFTWKTITEGKPRYVADTTHDKVIGPAGLEVGTKSYASMPIKFNGKTVGCININSLETNAFDDEELVLLGTVASQIEAAIGNARHAEALRQSENALKKSFDLLYKKNRYEKIISAVTKTVHKSIELDEVLENAVQAMSNNIEGADNISIYLVEENEAVLKAYKGYPKWLIKKIRKIPYPEGYTWQTIIEKKSRCGSVTPRDSALFPDFKDIGTKSYLSVPINFKNEVVGCININSLGKNAFEEEEFELIRNVSRQIEIAINNARQAEALVLSNEELEKRVAERTAELLSANKILELEVQERKRAEERYRALYEGNPSMYFTVDADGKVLSVNGFGASQLGYEVGELVGKSVLNVFHPEDKTKVQEQLNLALDKFGEVSAWELRKVRKDGSAFWVKEIARAIEGLDGRKAILVVCEDITDRKLADDELRKSRQQLRSLAAKVQSEREKEKSHLAREIHDEFGQALTCMKIDLSWLKNNLSAKTDVAPETINKRLDSVSKVLNDSVKTVRQIATRLRPGVLDALGLGAAIEWQAQEFQNRTGIRCMLTSNIENFTMDEKSSTEVFRIFQEILTNVARHADAKRVDVNIKRSDDLVLLQVRDYGRGITEDEVSDYRSLGLIGMRERALLLGGDLQIDGTPQKGTRVRLRIPIQGVKTH